MKTSKKGSDNQASDAAGSLWRRWDPHIHAPGTILNDQYTGANPWDDFLSKVEQANPTIQALGVTDYLSLDAYERVIQEKAQGRLPDVSLVFPNVEMRFAVAAAKGSPVNVHLLISPETKDHVEQARRLLLGLTFGYKGEMYRCSRDDLIRLGKSFDSSISDDGTALSVGTNQFKVDPDQLLGAIRTSAWAQSNVLIGVAGSNRDGTAQLQADTSLAALRKKLEASAQIIFASQPKQREFWLGKGAATVDDLRAEWGGCKPCLHGSDAHDQDAVGKPALDRFCWIKGDLTFESLRQACIEPEGRAFVGPHSPTTGTPSNLIGEVVVSGARWLGTPRLPLNPGLVAVIGARGSGKTALVEFVAAAGFAVSTHLSDRSFLRRAQRFLGKAECTLSWQSDEKTKSPLDCSQFDDFAEWPRVQYLSQQFVDRLCSSDGLADELVAEIQRVVFQAHAPEEREGATDFGELLQLRAARARTARQRYQQALEQASNVLIAERARKDALPSLRKQRDEKRAAVERDKKDLKGLVSKGQEARVKRFEAVSAAVESGRSRVDQARRKQQALLGLQDDVAHTRASVWPAQLQEKMRTFALAGLTSAQWKTFEVDFKGDVDALLKLEFGKAAGELKRLKGPAVGEEAKSAASDKDNPLLADDVDLSEQTLFLLAKELDRLKALVGIDQAKSRRYAQISEKIAKGEIELRKYEAEVSAAEGADAKIPEAVTQRGAAYRGVIQAIVDEQEELERLYAPLQADLKGETGTLSKLSFSVHRIVDMSAWAAAGEKLLDLRKAGPFKGAGALESEAKRFLLKAWETGNADEVASAMSAFREAHEKSIRAHTPAGTSERDAYRRWASQVGDWLYSTEHIRVSYGVQYEGVGIEQLSPGTRGIVLLLLYLAIDQEDDRPLIIDQPEENLDPKSIFDELVVQFRLAKLRRQIIVVTHNANLVVNTDADQVIVASSGAQRPGELPRIRYMSGGLENPEIRKHVCDILEGGTAAFIERARRLRIGLTQR